MTREQQIEDYLARNSATICPPADGNAPPLRRLRREREHALSCGDDLGADVLTDSDYETSLPECDEPTSAERAAERSMEAFGAARMNGASMSDALDDSRDAYNRGRRHY